MRICAIVMCLLLGGTTAAMAQESAAFGIKGGVNFANLRFEAEGENESFDRRTGFVGGLFMIWPAGSRVALQAEALYSQQGAKFDEEGADGKVKIDYFTVPVLLRLSSAPSGQAGFHVFGGPSLGYRLRARSSGTFDGESSSEDISDDIERFDLGVTAGAGVDINRFTIDGRYTWGLSNLNRDGSDELKITNRVATIMVGVRF
jgi:hypothetical protein